MIFNTELLGLTREVSYVKDEATAITWINYFLSATSPIYLDTETGKKKGFAHMKASGLQPDLSYIRLIQVGWQDKIVIFDLHHLKPGLFVELFKTKTFVAHYAIFEQMHISHAIAEITNLHCSFLASKILQHATCHHVNTRASLADMVRHYFKVDISKTTQTSDWNQEELSFQQLEYAALDILCLDGIWSKIVEDLKVHKLVNAYQINVKALPAVSQIQRAGLKLNKEKHFEQLNNWSKILFEKRQIIINKTRISDVTGHQLSHYLEKNLPKEIKLLWPKTDTGKLKTDSDTFESFAKVPLVAEIPFVEYQKYDKLVSSFGIKLQDALNPVTKRIHSNLNLLGTMTGRMSSSNPNCFTGDTEILTDTGWVRFDELKDYKGTVAQWDKGNISFTGWQYVEKEVDEDLVSYNTQQVSLVCTKDHRLLVNRPSDGLDVDVKADNLMCKGNFYASGTNMSNIDLPYSDTYLRLLIAIQADGTVNYRGVNFSFNRERKISRFKYLAEVGNIKYSETKPYSKVCGSRGLQTFYNYRLLKQDVIDKAIGDLTTDKLLPVWFLNLSCRQMHIVFEELFYWDGRADGTGYTSTIKHNCDIMQAVGTMLGYRCNISKEQYATKDGDVRTRYILNVSRNVVMKSVQPLRAAKQYIRYKGKVYCVSVPSSYILIRRNGKTLVTGQCQQMPRELEFRELFISESGNKLIVSDYSQIEVRVAAELSNDRKLKEVYEKQLDVYIQTASLVLKKPYSAITKKERNLFKIIVLASMYAMGGNKLKDTLKTQQGIVMSLDEVNKLRAEFKSAYSGYFSFQQKQAEFGEKYLLAMSKSGKKRKLDRDAWYGPSVNTCVQGTAAEVLLIALTLIHKQLAIQTKTGRLILTVHDEIICEASEKEASTVVSIMDKCMLDAYLTVFPNATTTKGLAEACIGNNWAEAKDPKAYKEWLESNGNQLSELPERTNTGTDQYTDCSGFSLDTFQ